jgi:hypothetical protein
MAPLKLLRPDIDRRFRGTDIALALKVGARGILVSGEFSAALMGGCIQLATPVPEDGTRYGTVTCETAIGMPLEGVMPVGMWYLADVVAYKDSVLLVNESEWFAC